MKVDHNLTTAGCEPVEESVSLCSIISAGQIFGIETVKIREVLDRRQVRRVPLAPPYIGGLVAYRGEVLSTVSLRALLGHAESSGELSVLVLEDTERGERFGLTVDTVDGVRTVNRCMLEENPSTLDSRADAIYAGAYKTPEGLIVHLDPRRLAPSLLARTSS